MKQKNVFGGRKRKHYTKQLADVGKACGPGVHHVTVRHDDNCPMINGGNDCTCDAVVDYGLPDGSGKH